MDAERVCNHKGLETGAHIIHAVGCRADEVSPPVAAQRLETPLIATHIETKGLEQTPPGSGGT